MERYLKESDVYALFPQSGIINHFHVADIDKLPRADVAPVIHARWELDSSTSMDYYGNEQKRYICSRCGASWVKPGPYCECGARMDLKPEEPYKEPITQLNRLQAMSADELAEFLSEILWKCHEAGYHGNGPWDEDGGTYCSEVLDCPLKEVCKTVLKDQGGKGNAICDAHTLKEWLNQVVDSIQEDKENDEVHT